MKKVLVSILACLLALALCTTALADNVLRPGDRGTKVKEAQKLLYTYGYYTSKIDGVYGKATTKAVLAFQEFNGLTADGKIGSKTMAVLTSGGAVPAKENSSDTIKQYQQLLKDYGYYTGKISGTINEAMTEAVREFQKYNNLKKTGSLDDATIEMLTGGKAVSAPITDKATANKDNVKHVQERLAAYGYYTLKIDGLYGAGTIAAVKAFQKANGLTVDGAVGQKTLALLDSDTAVSKAVDKDKQELEEHPILRKGDKKKAVKEAQQLLTNAGYYTGKINGEMDTATVKAVKAYQKANGLEADGKVGPNTWAKLLKLSDEAVPVVPEKKAPTVLRPGDESDYVKAMQEKLVTLGYSIKADGKYGDKTTAAVKKFQKKIGLVEDGKVGPKTMAAIDGEIAKLGK